MNKVKRLKLKYDKKNKYYIVLQSTNLATFKPGEMITEDGVKSLEKMDNVEVTIK